MLVVSRDDWHPGVVGLVAARLRERFGRPAFAIAWNGDIGTGSGRSVPGVDIGAAVRAAVEAGILAKGGGHAMAAGVTIRRERLGDLRAFLEHRLAASIRAAEPDKLLEIDGALSEAGATVAMIEEIERAGPFGNGNPAPVFAFPAHRVTFADSAGKDHVRVSLSSGAGGSLKAIAFRAADRPLGQALIAARGKPLHVAGTLSPRSLGRNGQAATPHPRCGGAGRPLLTWERERGSAPDEDEPRRAALRVDHPVAHFGARASHILRVETDIAGECARRGRPPALPSCAATTCARAVLKASRNIERLLGWAVSPLQVVVLMGLSFS